MRNLGICVDDFNPKIMYTFEKKFGEDDSVNIHHHDFLTIIYLLSGSCIYKINDVSYKVKKGDILLINPGVHHSKIMPPGGESIEFHAGFENIKINNLKPNHIIEDGASPILNSSNYETELFKCCNDIIQEQCRNDIGSELILKSLGMKLLAILIKAIYESHCSKAKGCLNVDIYDKTTIVNTIIEFIDENYMKDLSLDIISQTMYLSPAYISKIFKEETGESPINHLIKVRLSKAEDYLKDGSYSIKEIANFVGYQDAYHFSKLFKKYYGYPPSTIKAKI
jgi:AraC-like DNA-binding protein